MAPVSRLAVPFLLGLTLLWQPGVAAEDPNAAPLPGVHTIRADDALLDLAAAGGFAWLVQLVEWREVEPAPGDLFWEYTDWLVRAADYYHLDLALRLDHPPAWALAPDDGVPVDVAAYAAWAGQVAARYRGRVTAYVVWNEPNLAAEWAGQAPDPAGYRQLLCAAAAAIRAADPEALVVSAGLAPTNHDGDTALDERRYLAAMYEAGARGCFDVLGAHPYGFAYPPDDAYGAHEGLNVRRLADQRAIMVENGDRQKPVWATELGWTTDPVEAGQQWLWVSEEEQARYLVDAFRQAAAEWPWLERVAVWNLSRGLPAGDEKRGYSILQDDGGPKPAYQALAAMLEEGSSPAADEQEPGSGDVQVLAPDVVVRLSDVAAAYPHWARPHCGAVPCRSWTGQFYVREPGDGTWLLRLELMQVEEPGSLVQINGRLLDPPGLPLRGRPDYASVWTAVEMPVPAGVLQPGLNTVEIQAGPRLPAYQDAIARFESLQIRHVRLVRAP
ncbi:MAG: hypothetical protein P8129_17420 [Anaerolineae bacterium]